MNHKIELEKALRKLKDIELALNESSIVAITDNRGIIQFANDKFCNMSKYSRNELIGSRQNIVNSGHHSQDFFKEMWRTIGRGKVWKGEIKNKAKDGTYYWVDTTIVPFLKENGRPYQYISIRHDITKRIEYEETIKQMAYYDPLTLLPNRNLLNEWLNEYVNKEGKLAVLFLDIDRFKSINDNYGHRTGDMILKELAKRLQTCIRTSDLIVRQGGDEFVIFLTDVDNKDDILKVVQRIKKQFNVPFTVNGNKIIATTSIGISLEKMSQYESDYLDLVEEMIRQADTAMYHAKQNGGNSHCFISDDQNDELRRYYQLEQEIKHALEEDEFSIVYQPLINLRNDKITGVEALLRWNNEKLGSVSPGEFIPLLEELGLIIPVGNWVLQSVCDQMVSWHKKGFSIDRVAVNVSPIQFVNQSFVHDVKEIIRETKMDPVWLELEITEGTILNIDKVEKTLKELRDLGVHISIDDFGTGYSSLNYLKRLPINTLKIDQSFIRDLDVNDEVIVNTIITMAKNLQFNIIAEGIETDYQLSYLKDQDCHEGQGYYFSKPIDARELEQAYKCTSLKPNAI
ncbi:bifunctional diguanylate cyclase/phosphodiesterase [Oceanobacillus sp. Castelsardo]|uniref:putative bifunctional diguanylate cyclase/phosphodiesterase n=1 Tax=Oceanobacillus sp. Castelsardo TaxID=1851204 RepID=UPI000839AB8A|nr:EAL domain-containing protein [Oceanobacillus sp. Castelsardo]